MITFLNKNKHTYVCIYIYMYVSLYLLCQLLSRVSLFVTSQTVAHQAPLSMEFSKQEYRSGLPFPSPRDLPDPEMEPRSPTLQAVSLPSEPPGKPICASISIYLSIYLSVYLSIYLPICLSVCLFVYLSTSVSDWRKRRLYKPDC